METHENPILYNKTVKINVISHGKEKNKQEY